jgi:putative membrane protein
MLTDALLAIAHHILMFALLGVLVIEMMMLRPGIGAAGLNRLARIDAIYGTVAGLIVVGGFSRVFFGIKGPEYYLPNPVFWAKMVAFVIVGLFSIVPTRRILHWRRTVNADATFTPAESELARVKQLMHYEGMAFITMPIFAALMARGYGL